MYGFDGDMSAEEWANLVGFRALQPRDQIKLINEGKYTSDGHKIISQQEGMVSDMVDQKDMIDVTQP